MPSELKAATDEWELLDGVDHFLYGEYAADADFPWLFDAANELWPDAEPGTRDFDMKARFISDVLRWEFIEDGGLYVDCDIRPVAPIEKIIEDRGREVLAAGNPNHPQQRLMPWGVMNAFLYCPEGSKLTAVMQGHIKNIIDYALFAPKKVGCLTGPVALSAIYPTVCSPRVLSNGTEIVTEGERRDGTLLMHAQSWRGRRHA